MAEHRILTFICVMGLALVGVSGCASSQKAGQNGVAGMAPPPLQNQIPTLYTQIDPDSAERPGWIDIPPDDANELHFLVGLSEHHPSERAAREDAMRHARMEYAQYTGVDVAIVDEVISSLYGKASDILDATIAQTTKATAATNAKVSRVKAKQWYAEKYRAYWNGQSRGIVYKYWVLVSVPVDEYARVQQFLIDQAGAADHELQGNLQRTAATIAMARAAASSGDVLQALNLIEQEWNLLDVASKRFTEGDKHYRAGAIQLQSAQKKLIAEIGAIRSTLLIDTGRFGMQIVSTAGLEGMVTAWVWTRSNGTLQPVQEMPLVLRDDQGNRLAQAVSGPGGRADFAVTNLETGQYRVAVDPENGAMALLAKMFGEVFAKVETRLSLAMVTTDMRGATKGAVMDLFGGAANEPLPVQKVIMGPVNYGTSKLGSSFALALKQMIRQHLTRIDGLVVVEPRKRDAQMVTDVVKTRGIDLKETNSITILGTPAMQAAIDGADAALEVSYTVQGAEVWIEMNLKEAGTDVLRGAATAVVARETIPPGLEVVVPGATQIAGSQPEAVGEIRLDISSHLGDGQTYQEGDVISYFVNNDRDAYLLLVYEDAEHSLIQILPNRFSGKGFYQAGAYIEVPGPRDKFEFVIQGPFGQERLWAFAATRKFPVLAGRPLASGLTLLQDNMAEILTSLRKFGNNPGVAYGEAQTMITTVGK